MKKLAILSLSMMLAAGAQAQTAEFDYFKYAGNDVSGVVDNDCVCHPSTYLNG